MWASPVCMSPLLHGTAPFPRDKPVVTDGRRTRRSSRRREKAGGTKCVWKIKELESLALQGRNLGNWKLFADQRPLSVFRGILYPETNLVDIRHKEA